MILVQPQYLPSVNFFKDFDNNDINVDVSIKYEEAGNINNAVIVNSSNAFNIKVPVIKPKSNAKLKDIQIDYSKNWINSHIQSIQSSYGKFPYYIYYIDEITHIIKMRHNFLVDLNYDLLALLHKRLNFNSKLSVLDNFSSQNHLIKDDEYLFSNFNSKKIEIVRKDFFLGKVFDYKVSVIDLLFLKGPESGFFIRNFKKKN